MSEAPAAPPALSPAPRSRGLIIALIIIGVLLLIGITALVTVLLVGGRSSTDAAASGSTATASDTPVPSPTQSATSAPAPQPSATSSAPAPAPAPAPAASAKFTDFTYPSALTCSNASPATPAFVPEISFSWASSNAVQAWFVMGNSDAADSNFQQIPLKGNQDDLKSVGLDPKMQCSYPQTQFTITLVDGSGKHVSKTATIKNNGDIAP